MAVAGHQDIRVLAANVLSRRSPDFQAPQTRSSLAQREDFIDLPQGHRSRHRGVPPKYAYRRAEKALKAYCYPSTLVAPSSFTFI